MRANVADSKLTAVIHVFIVKQKSWWKEGKFDWILTIWKLYFWYNLDYISFEGGTAPKANFSTSKNGLKMDDFWKSLDVH